MSRDLASTLVAEVLAILEPVDSIADDPAGRVQLFEQLGWDLQAIDGLDATRLAEAFAQVRASFAALWAMRSAAPADLAAVQGTLTAARIASDAVRALASALPAEAVVRVPQLRELPADLLGYLTARYLFTDHPALYALGEIATLITAPDAARTRPLADASGRVVRKPTAYPAFRFDRIGGLLADPAAALAAEYMPAGGLADDAAAVALADKLFPRLRLFFEAMGLPCGYGIDPLTARVDPSDDALSTHALSISMIGSAGTGEPLQPIAGVRIALSPRTRGDLGFVFTPVGGLTFEQTIESWRLALSASAAVDAFAVGPRGVVLRAPTATPRLLVHFEADKLAADDAGAALLFGAAAGTRLEVGQLRFRAAAGLAPAEQIADIGWDASRAALVIAAGDGDGFLQQILPREGLRVDFDLGIGWSNQKGLYFRGSAGLEATLPVRQSLLGILTLDSIYLALRADERTGVRATVAATTAVRLGPVTANVERFGIEAALTFPPPGGNLGLADLALRFRPPTGAGLVIDADVVTGGGYLFFDADRQQYAGVLQLEIAGKIAVKAVGLLTTKLSDGRPGFSLVILVTAEGFSPIPLGFGFSLTGIGGLLGVNRTVSVDALRTGLRQGSLDAVLFPADPIANAPQILGTLDTVFPAARDRFFAGPVARISWGTPVEVLAIDLALVLEIPEPVRLFVLARLTATLPDRQRAIVHVRMDALGVVDFNTGEIALDATLYDSRLADFALTGDMALRASWGTAQTFVLAIGGTHPRFALPPAFPQLERLAIGLGADANPRMRLEAYLALTSNTVQFGARIDLYAAAAGFELQGFFGFDTLFNLSPFSFVADVGGLLALRQGTRVVTSVRVEMMLAGPRPWHVRGKARLEFFGIVHELAFEHRVGPAERPALLPPVAVLPLLREALLDARNWSSELQKDEHPLVTLRSVQVAGARLMHPLATLTVRQRIVPLDQPVTRFGSTRPSDGPRFSIAARETSGAPLAVVARSVLDSFAPAQFRDMTDDEKLSSPSFVAMPAGLTFGSQMYDLAYAPAHDINIGYTTVVVTSGKELATAASSPAPVVAATTGVAAGGAATPPHIVPAAVLETAVPQGASARSPLWRTGRERFRTFEEAV